MKGLPRRTVAAAVAELTVERWFAAPALGDRRTESPGASILDHLEANTGWRSSFAIRLMGWPGFALGRSDRPGAVRSFDGYAPGDPARAVAGFAAGLVELVMTGAARGLWASVWVTLGVGTVIVGAWTLVVALVGGLALRLAGGTLARVLARLRLPDLLVLAALLAGLAVLTSMAVGFTDHFNDRRAAGLVVGGVAAILATGAWGLWRGAAALPVRVTVAAAVVILVAVFAFMDKDALVTLGATRAIGPGIAALSLSVLAHPGNRWLRGAATRASWVALAIAPVGVIWIFLSSPVRAATAGSSALPRALLAAGLAALDRDGDGHARWLAGGDCDDSRPHVFPLAPEIPGNGIDENCCGGDGPEAAPAAPLEVRVDERTRPIVWILIDTLRADRLGKPGVTPVLDGFAKEAVRFEAAYAPSCKTGRSVPSLVTGRYPSEVLVRPGDPDLGVPNLLDAIVAGGFDTAAIISHGTLAYWLKPIRTKLGVKDLTTARYANAKHVTDGALRVIRGRRQEHPMFIIVHYYDPHWPYSPPEEWQRFGESRAARYDGEVAFVDSEIRRLLSAVGRELPEAVIAVSSDHGEELGDHGGDFHARTLYEEAVHVPLLIRAPGLAPRAVRQPVELRVLLPSLLELSGAASVDPPSDDIARLARGQDVPRRPVYLEMIPGAGLDRKFPPRHALVLPDGTKAIYTPTTHTLEIYDLRSDPHERRDLRGRDPTRAARARSKLCEVTEGLRPPPL